VTQGIILALIASYFTCFKLIGQDINA